MTEQFTVRKCLLKTIIKDTGDDLLTKIKQTVINYNQTTTLVYQFVKAYWLHQYSLNNSVNIVIDTKFLTMCFKLLSIDDNRGNKIKNPLYKSLKDYYDTYFKDTIQDIQFKTLTKTSFIKQYQIISMLTAYENNIKCHFESRLFKYLQSVFINSEMDTKEQDIIKAELRILKRDLIFKRITNDKYKKWILSNKKKILPETDYYETLNKHPLKLLNYMFYMNLELEKNNNKTYNCVPLRNDYVPKYITIDTASLINLTKTKGVGKLIQELDKSIWNEYFKTNKKIFRSNKVIKINGIKYKHKFNGMISTDGIGVSIYLELMDSHGNSIKSNKVKKNKSNEFKNFSELKESELEYVKNSKRIYIDPGKSNLICCIDDNDNTYIHRMGKRMYETKRIKKMNIINKEKNMSGINELETELSKFNGKTSDHNNFLNFITNKNKVNDQIMKFYEMELFRKMKFRSFNLTQKSESNVVKELKEKYGSDTVLMYGDKNVGKQIKNFISTPMIGFKRMLKKHFKIYDVDEFRTSKLDNKTTDEKVLICKNLINKVGKEIIRVSVSKILIEGSNGKYIKSYINRDINACKNIRKIVNYGLENNLKRPKWYNRNEKLPVSKNTSKKVVLKMLTKKKHIK